jgi:hypothetical protein
MRTGYAGRNSAKRSWATGERIQNNPATVACLNPEQSKFVVSHAVSSTAACRIQNFAEVRSSTSPFACVRK